MLRCAAVMRLMDERERKDLRCLDGPELRAIDGAADFAILDQFDGVLDGDGGDGGLVLAGGMQASFKYGGGNERSRPVMDHYPAAGGVAGCQGVKTCADRVLSALTAGDQGGDFAPTLLFTERCRVIDTFGVEHQNDDVDNGRAFEYVDGARQGDTSGQRCPEFIATLHTAACSRGYNDGG